MHALQLTHVGRTGPVEYSARVVQARSARARKQAILPYRVLV
jgi:hypothetical protein